MTSDEIREREFSVGFRGYKKEEVDEFLLEMAALFEAYEEREQKRAAEEQLRKDQEEAYIEHVEAKASGILTRAETEAAQIRQQAEAILEDAKDVAARQEQLALEGKQACLDEAEEEAAALRREAQASAEALRKAAEEETGALRRKTEAEAEALRQAVEEAAAAMRQEASGESEELLTRSRKEAKELLDRAKAVEANAVTEAARKKSGVRQSVRMIEEEAEVRLKLITELLEQQQEWARASRTQMEEMIRKQQEVFRKYEQFEEKM